MAASEPEQLLLRASLRGEELLLLLRHKVRYEDWEGGSSQDDGCERDVEVARSMTEAAEVQRAALRTLAGARAWAPPAALLRGAASLRSGGGT